VYGMSTTAPYDSYASSGHPDVNMTGGSLAHSDLASKHSAVRSLSKDVLAT
jgi:hypothetical protein